MTKQQRLRKVDLEQRLKELDTPTGYPLKKEVRLLEWAQIFLFAIENLFKGQSLADKSECIAFSCAQLSSEGTKTWKKKLVGRILAQVENPIFQALSRDAKFSQCYMFAQLASGIPNGELEAPRILPTDPDQPKKSRKE